MTLGWVKLEWGSCFWDGDERDILQRRILKDSVILLLSQGMVHSRRDEGGSGNQSQLSTLFHLWSPKYKKWSCGCRQFGLKGYCSVVHRCFGPHPCLHQVIATPQHLQVHLIPHILLSEITCSVLNIIWNLYFFLNHLILDRAGLRDHLHGRNEMRMRQGSKLGSVTILGQLCNNVLTATWI